MFSILEQIAKMLSPLTTLLLFLSMPFQPFIFTFWTSFLLAIEGKKTDENCSICGKKKIEWNLLNEKKIISL
jgi:hypothetical protein